MADSKFDICNRAMGFLGVGNNITTFDTNTKEARLCERYYDPTRRAVLRAHPWNFAIKRVTLAQDATAPNHEYTYRHALPADYLKVIRTADEALGYDDSYRLEGGFLVSDEGTVKVEYIADIEDTTLFDPLFEDVLAQRMAAEMSVAFTDNSALTERLWKIYQDKLMEARSVESQEGRPRDIEASQWINSRY